MGPPMFLVTYLCYLEFVKVAVVHKEANQQKEPMKETISILFQQKIPQVILPYRFRR